MNDQVKYSMLVQDSILVCQEQVRINKESNQKVRIGQQEQNHNKFQANFLCFSLLLLFGTALCTLSLFSTNRTLEQASHSLNKVISEWNAWAAKPEQVAIAVNPPPAPPLLNPIQC